MFRKTLGIVGRLLHLAETGFAVPKQEFLSYVFDYPQRISQTRRLRCDDGHSHIIKAGLYFPSSPVEAGSSNVFQEWSEL
jgi:hypothetical protein